MKRIRSTVNTFRYQAADSNTGGFTIFRSFGGFTILRNLGGCMTFRNLGGCRMFRNPTLQNKIYHCGANSSCEKIV
jgi:hypothetical protein